MVHWEYGMHAWYGCKVDASVAHSRVQQVAGSIRAGAINLG